MRIAENVSSIPSSPHRMVVSIADRKRKEGKVVFNFSQGQPGLPPDQQALEAFADRLLKHPFDLSKYGETKGLTQLRQAVSQDLKSYGSVDVPPDQMIVTDGAVEGLDLTLTCLTKPGDRLLLLEPCYSVYWDLLRLHGLRAVAVGEKLGTGFQPSPEELKGALEEDVAAVILCSPDNPTSRIISKEAVDTIVDGVIDKGIPLLYDEAYKHVLYEGVHLWIHNRTGLSENLISLNSFSKDLAIPGFRLGYMYGPKGFIEQATKVKAMTSICSPTPSQYLALTYFELGRKEPYLREVLPVYRRRRDALYRAVSSHLSSARVLRPTAGMYLFPDLSAYLNPLMLGDVDFCMNLAEEGEVITIPGSISGPSGVGHVRMCFVGENEEKLEEGVLRLSSYLSKIGPR
ncbi:MAG TPA: pyridoxal phosphate-dependent aminotransferase [Conexivisphaerales archaeon]|nr:pyridoxal phosphate-dependent aminotransferase [Conexivisphaerales archaeon]